MKFEGTVTIQAPRDEVWAFLTDPDAVSLCAPGLKSMEIIEPDKRFRAVAAVGIGSMKATFTTDVEWTELEPPQRAEMKARGNAPGSAVEATAEMKLRKKGENATELAWTADVVVMGTIAALASRMMGGVTQKLTGEFFECVRSRIEG